MAAKCFVAIAVALVASPANAAPSVRISEPRPARPVPEPCPPTTTLPAPTEPDTKLCVNVPQGLEGVMVPNVGYEVSPAIYCQKENCESMTLWCQHDKKGHEKYWYCCGDHCESIPKERTCEIQGEEYTVGIAHEDIKLEIDGEAKKVDYLWCLSEDEYVTCSGDACGSSVELTPPGVDVCVPQPPTPPKPTPPPMLRPDQCMDCKTCTSWGYKWTAAGCTDRCVPDTFCVSTPQQCTPPKLEYNHECVRCVKSGKTWELSQGQCHDGLICPRIAGAKCTQSIADCKYHPMPF